ncbi:MAG: tagaturonate epimerase family protein [Succiniclasticum sp.]|uniref:tagaturonate epimerase family protein n=1 Tax=Succiniclasticum sp. TaxID=2775030 RepID=UPI002A918A95|nr:tagaturonate epimerase family protein [Succiniclasticum sp.]MDY6291530.1 tagaturonate epimerase family protein [Succiniclasticum sp.]
MAIKREIAEKLMSEKGTLIGSSFSVIPDGYLGLVDNAAGRQLAVVCGVKSEANNAWKGAEFEPAADNKKIKMGLFPLNPNNAALIRRLVSWAAPSSCGVNGISVAFSDWLGVVNSQLPNLFARKQIKPVLTDFTPEFSAALQRNFLEAMDTATWSVLSSGYKGGWAANATGLKTEEEIVKALLYGYSGIGVDCSDKIDRSIEGLSTEETEKRFGELDRDFKEAIDKSYLDAEFQVGDVKIKFEEKALHRMVLEFGQAIMFLQNMYKDYLDDTPWDLDFEVDLSRSDKPLTPQEHYFLANELKRAAVKFDTLCVNASIFEQEMKENLAYHAGIAKAFDYRMSFADAALAFDDLAAVAKNVNYRVNFKLTHVLWLAALQTVAKTDAALLKQMAERAGLAVPSAEDLTFEREAGIAFVNAYDKILGKEEGKEILPVKEAVEKEKGLYEENLAAIVNGFIRML